MDSGAAFLQRMRDNGEAQETGQNVRARRELVDVWPQVDGQWKLARAISCDHRLAE